MSIQKLALVPFLTLALAASIGGCSHHDAAPPPAAPAPPPPPPAPVAAPAPLPLPVPVKTAKLIGNRVHIPGELEFDLDKATLKTDSQDTKDILTALHDFLAQNPQVTQLRVEGHTDDSGKAEHNMKLSQERADAVVAWEIQAGVDKSRLLAKGMGASKPVAANDTEEHRHENRRTEFHVSMIDGKPAPKEPAATASK